MSRKGPTVLEWRGEVPAGVRVTAARIVLAHTRTLLHEMELRTSTGAYAESFEIEGFVATLVLSEPLFDPSASIEVTLSITFRGEAPRPIGVTINGDKVIEFPDWFPAGVSADSPVPPEVAARLWALELDRLAVPVSRAALASTAMTDDDLVFEERDLAIQRDDLIRRAFYDHDFATNPHKNAPTWSAEMSDLNDFLGDRVEIYAKLGQSCKWPEHGPLAEPMLGKLVAVSAAFRAIFEGLTAAEPSGDPAIDLFDWAFEHFVTGAVVTRHNDLDWQDVLLSHGAPNSSYFLRFAMLAVACLESSVDEPFWQKHLRTLVRTAHIFLESAAPLEDAPYPSLELHYAFYPDRTFPRSRRKELRAEYAAGIGAGDPWDVEFAALRARMASLFGLAILLPAGLGSSAPQKPIPADLTASLKPQGIGAPVTHACGP